MKNLIISILVCFVAANASAQITSGDYYRIINTQTRKYVSIADNEFSAADIVVKCGGGKALALDRNITYKGTFNGDNSHVGETMPARTAAFIHAGKFLAKDITLIDASDGNFNPGTIIKISKNGDNYNLEGQNVKLSEITNQGTTTSSATITIPSHYATLTQVSGSTYTASMTLKVNVPIPFIGGNIAVGTKYFIDNNGKFAIDDNGDASNNGQWEIVPVNEANLNSNYLAIKTIAANEQYGKYYTTFRAAFPFKVASTSTMKVYNITSTAAGVATLEQIPSNSIVPAGLPVVIESDNLDDAYNKIVPNTKSGTARTTALYNNYGVNDNEIDYSYKNDGNYRPTNLNEGSGDKIGYFNVKKYTGSPIYKFGINEDGRVGFWTPVASNEVINGNEAYSTVQCALFPAPTDVELKELPNNFETGYHITDSLTVAYVDGTNKVIYAKDNNGAGKQLAGENVDFMALHYSSDEYADAHYGDHSNWVAIKVASMPTVVEKDMIEATGKVVDGTSPNRTIQGRVTKLNSTNSNYNPNTYSIANFYGTQAFNGTTYFFAKPVANEIGQIIWAMWDGEKFVVPQQGVNENGEPINDARLTGSVVPEWNLYPSTAAMPEKAWVYKFLGLIQKRATSSSLKAETDEYVLYPLTPLEYMGQMGEGEVYTAIDNLGSKSVTSVKYYNMMGVESDVPFQGVNIVVTRYDDGTQSTAKVVK